MRTALYVRVSTQRQSQAQTIEQQLTRVQAHLETQGERLRPAWMFRDDGYSGATLNRPGLDRLRDAVRGAEVDRVLITTPDRLARNMCIRWSCWKSWSAQAVPWSFSSGP
jgi:site-specific DNA recombinase